jgi:hypothetical protein
MADSADGPGTPGMYGDIPGMYGCDANGGPWPAGAGHTEQRMNRRRGGAPVIGAAGVDHPGAA